MTSRSEFCSRAGLCRLFALLEPASRTLWLAEAEYWARLSKAAAESADGTGNGDPLRIGLRARLARRLAFPQWVRFAAT
jgi:hypothetical protein